MLTPSSSTGRGSPGRTCTPIEMRDSYVLQNRSKRRVSELCDELPPIKRFCPALNYFLDRDGRHDDNGINEYMLAMENLENQEINANVNEFVYGVHNDGIGKRIIDSRSTPQIVQYTDVETADDLADFIDCSQEESRTESPSKLRQTRIDDFFRAGCFQITKQICINGESSEIDMGGGLDEPEMAVDALCSRCSEPTCALDGDDEGDITRCFYCTKMMCNSCVAECAECLERYCYDCITLNYDMRYQRTLCLDCNSSRK